MAPPRGSAVRPDRRRGAQRCIVGCRTPASPRRRLLEDTVDPGGGMSDIPAELESLRGSIDNLDAVLIHVLAERFKLTERVGRLKAHHALPAADAAREARQVERLR